MKYTVNGHEISVGNTIDDVKLTGNTLKDAEEFWDYIREYGEENIEIEDVENYGFSDFVPGCNLRHILEVSQKYTDVLETIRDFMPDSSFSDSMEDFYYTFDTPERVMKASVYNADELMKFLNDPNYPILEVNDTEDIYAIGSKQIKEYYNSALDYYIGFMQKQL